jgi:hypothetical protein
VLSVEVNELAVVSAFDEVGDVAMTTSSLFPLLLDIRHQCLL